MFRKSKKAGRSEDEFREKFTQMAMDAGYSGEFSPFGQPQAAAGGAGMPGVESSVPGFAAAQGGDLLRFDLPSAPQFRPAQMMDLGAMPPFDMGSFNPQGAPFDLGSFDPQSASFGGTPTVESQFGAVPQFGAPLDWSSQPMPDYAFEPAAQMPSVEQAASAPAGSAASLDALGEAVYSQIAANMTNGGDAAALYGAVDNEMAALVSARPAAREIPFKRSLVGGFQKQSVWSFVDDLNDSFLEMQIGFEKQFRDLSAERESIARECRLLHRQIDVIEQRKHDDDQALGQLRADKEDLQQQLQTLLEDSQRSLDEADQLRRRVEELEQARGIDDAEIQALLDAKDAELRELLAEKDAELYEKAVQLDALAQKCQVLTARVEECELRIAELNHELDLKIAELEQMTRQLELKAGDPAEVAELKQRLAELDDEAYRLRCEKEQSDSALLFLEGIVGKMTAEMETCVDMYERLESDNMAQADLFAEATSTVERLRGENDRLLIENNMLAKDLSRMTDNLGRLANERDRIVSLLGVGTKPGEQGLDAFAQAQAQAGALAGGQRRYSPRQAGPIPVVVRANAPVSRLKSEPADGAADAEGIDIARAAAAVQPAGVAVPAAGSSAHAAEFDQLSRLAERVLSRMTELNKRAGADER